MKKELLTKMQNYRNEFARDAVDVYLLEMSKEDVGLIKAMEEYQDTYSQICNMLPVEGKKLLLELDTQSNWMTTLEALYVYKKGLNDGSEITKNMLLAK